MGQRDPFSGTLSPPALTSVHRAPCALSACAPAGPSPALGAAALNQHHGFSLAATAFTQRSTAARVVPYSLMPHGSFPPIPHGQCGTWLQALTSGGHGGWRPFATLMRLRWIAAKPGAQPKLWPPRWVQTTTVNPFAEGHVRAHIPSVPVSPS